MRYRWIMFAGLLLLLAGILLGMALRVVPATPENTVSTADLGMMLLDDADGVSVLAVQEGSAAEHAGIRPADLLLQVNGVSFTTADELDTLLHGMEDSAIRLYLQRSGCGMEICIPAEP